MGDAQELAETGSQRSVVAGAGGWRSLALSGYVDLRDKLSQDIAKLLIEHYDFELGRRDGSTLGSRIGIDLSRR